MKIKELSKNNPAFQYVIDSMEFMSTAGRHAMLNTTFSADADWLEQEWDRIGRLNAMIGSSESKRYYIDLKHCLMQLHDLQQTLLSLGNHTPLNEVELFEIKNLASISRTARTAIAHMNLDDTIIIPDLSEVFSILDPDHTGTPNFYIYDSFDQRLSPLRKELKTLQINNGDPIKISELLAQQNDIQQDVCLKLTDALFPWQEAIATTLKQLAYADCLLAKATLTRLWNLVRPTIGDHTIYRGLVNYRLKHRNEELHLRYQPIDIDIKPGVCLITGANMAGKTVLLKSIGTAQMMIQCGMYAPADEAQICLMQGVVTSIGDEQNEMNGLSSYASEIIKISDILKQCRESQMLVLIDEPARTTNPVEGKALVQAIITILQPLNSITLITTHYSQLGSDCRRLRVKGFVEGMTDIPLTPQSINRFIDYSLTEETSDEVPQEALRIASILNCDADMIRLAHQNLKK